MDKNLLILTVGGSPEPLIASIKHWQPTKVIFIASKDSKLIIDGIIQGVSKGENAWKLDVLSHSTVTVNDPQDMEACIHDIEGIQVEVSSWNNRDDDCKTIMDFTGGTKCMSATLALFAQNWECEFFYVGGTERSKNSMGSVLDGKEKLISKENPWKKFGRRELEKAMEIFNAKFYLSAAASIDLLIKNSFLPKYKKSQMLALKNLADALGAWDAFNHQDAKRCFEDVIGKKNDLIGLVGADLWDQINQFVFSSLKWLEEISKQTISKNLIGDLFLNGLRRHSEKRFDDATGRFYRCTEALAQFVLSSRHQLSSTSKVNSSLLPFEMQKPDNFGFQSLALQDCYKYLLLKKDPLGVLFDHEGLNTLGSVINARNNSILAHGFETISEKCSNSFQQQILVLLKSEGINPVFDVPECPKISPYV